MNTPWGIMNHPLTHRMGWALLHSLWQGALVGAMFVLLRFALRRRSAHARYLAGCLSLGLLLAALVLTLLSGQTPSTVPVSGPSAAPVSRASVVSTFTGAALPVFSFGMGQSSYSGGSNHSLLQGGGDFLGRLAPLLAAAWLLGVAFFSARLARSWWWH